MKGLGMKVKVIIEVHFVLNVWTFIALIVLNSNFRPSMVLSSQISSNTCLLQLVMILQWTYGISIQNRSSSNMHRSTKCQLVGFAFHQQTICWCAVLVLTKKLCSMMLLVRSKCWLILDNIYNISRGIWTFWDNLDKSGIWIFRVLIKILNKPKICATFKW